MSLSTAVKAFLAIAFWGASFVATKVVLQEISPLLVVALRFALGVVVMLLALAWRRQAARVERRDLAWLALLGLNGIAVHQLLQANGLVTTTATNSGWIIALIPVFTAILAWLLAGEPFGRLKLLGLLVASAGALLVINRGGLLHGASLGDGLLLLSAANWALFTTLSKRLIGKYPPAVMMTYVMALGWLMVLPLLAGQAGWRTVFGMSAAGWLSIIFLGIACSGLAYIFWYDALAEVEASRVASFLYLEPIVTVVVAALLIGEPVTWSTAAGGATILVGVWLVNH